jgi:hypothetical protein
MLSNIGCLGFVAVAFIAGFFSAMGICAFALMIFMWAVSEKPL